MATIKEVLRKSEFFGELTEEELDKIVKVCRQEVYEAGAEVFSEGNIARELYVVEEGKVVLDMGLSLGTQSRRRATIEIVTPGEAFGWSAVDGQAFTSSARCLENTKVIAVDTAGLRHLFDEDYRIAYEVTRKLLDIVRSRLSHVRGTLAHVLSVASHDLKAPLAAVQSYHHVMLDGYAGEITEKQRNMLLRSKERIAELLNLIDDILDISRMDTGEFKKEKLYLKQVARHCLATLRPLANERGVKLRADLPPLLPPISGASDRLQQVFTNLLANAIKFTPKGGKVTLRVKDNEAHLLVEVMDTGIGIPEEELPRIFDDFYRGSAAESGAGLGLAIAKKIVEGHGGRIWAESPYPESERGTKFTFTLPKK